MKALTKLVLLMFFCSRVSAQCPPVGNIVLTSQAEINNFQTLYGSCPNLIIDGNLQIGGTDIISLVPLAGVKGVTGSLEIFLNDELTTLTGLENIESIGATLDISRNAKLNSLQGLANITAVGNRMYIEENSRLINLNGLSKLETVGGNVYIKTNNNLIDIGGLSALTSINGGIIISYNAELQTPGNLPELTNAFSRIEISNNAKMKSLPNFPKLEDFQGHVEIDNCPELTSLAGLSTLKSIEGNLEIVENALITNLDGLGSLQSIGMNLLIENNSSLIDMSGLSSLITVAGEMDIRYNHNLETPGTLTEFTDCGYLRVRQNDKLKSLPSFPKMVNSTGNIRIEQCPELLNIEGLSSLETVKDDLLVEENSSLASLSGLRKLREVRGDLGVGYNESLSDISGLSALTYVGIFFDISSLPALITPGTLPEFTGAGEDIFFQNNANMTSLPNFPKLVSYSGYFSVEDCPALVSLAGLSALTNFNGNLRLLNNSSLSTCAVAGICSLLNTAPYQTSIENNATGCNTAAEIQEACENVLPVTLVNFSGKMNTEGFATLAWSTSSETNSAHFVIEHRSPGSEQWSAVGKVPAKRESSVLVSYDFLHSKPLINENLYRLKMVDIDNTFAYSRIISIRKDGVVDIYAYPNPVLNKLHFSGSGRIKELSVFDVNGRLRLTKYVTGRNEIDLGNLIPGKYLIKMKTADGRSHTQNVVKE